MAAGVHTSKMKVSVKVISPVARKIDVELPEEKVNQQLKKAYSQLNRSVKVKGFRPGKVPITILKRHYADQVAHDVGLDLVNETLMEALEQTEIQVVSQSDLERGPLQEGEPFRYSFVVEAKPEIEVSEYKKLPAQKERLSVTDTEVEAELQARRQANAYLRNLAKLRPIEQGDHALLDFKTFVEGRPVPNGESKGFLLEVGGNSFHADFETKLIGTSKGDQTEIEVSYPADYGNKHLAGKIATFQVEVKDIKERVLPDLDDDFAKDLGEFETLEELRAAVRQEVVEKKREQINNEIGRQLIEELISRNSFEVPQGMVERELQSMIDTVLYRLQAQNLTLEQAGIDENIFKERNREMAEKKVRKSILLERIGVRENMEISDEDLEAGLRRSAENSQQPYEQIRGFYEKSNLIEPFKQQLMEEKIIEFLKDHAEITEVDIENTSSADDKSKKEENS